jgi:hypothetical protein
MKLKLFVLQNEHRLTALLMERKLAPGLVLVVIQHSKHSRKEKKHLIMKDQEMLVIKSKEFLHQLHYPKCIFMLTIQNPLN